MKDKICNVICQCSYICTSNISLNAVIDLLVNNPSMHMLSFFFITYFSLKCTSTSQYRRKDLSLLSLHRNFNRMGQKNFLSVMLVQIHLVLFMY